VLSFIRQHGWSLSFLLILTKEKIAALAKNDIEVKFWNVIIQVMVRRLKTSEDKYHS
jgi:hypothetical protein